MERESAEAKRKQRERLESAAKRRSTATCSMRDREIEGVALESVLQRFLILPESRRRARTPSPTGSNLPEILGKSNRTHRDSKKPSLTLNLSGEKENMRKENAEERKTQRRSPSLSWKTSGNRVSVTIEDDEGQTEEEVQKLREVSQKVLRYQSSRGSVTSPVASPLRRGFQDGDETPATVSNIKDTAEPPKSPVFFIPKSPGSIGRRHTIVLPANPRTRTNSHEDQFLPGEPVVPGPKKKIVAIRHVGKLQSADSYLPQIYGSSVTETEPDTPAEETSTCPEPVSETSTSGQTHDAEERGLSSLEPSDPIKEENTQTKKTSRFLSFFKRLGEKSKANSTEITESSSVDP